MWIDNCMYIYVYVYTPINIDMCIMQSMYIYIHTYIHMYVDIYAMRQKFIHSFLSCKIENCHVKICHKLKLEYSLLSKRLTKEPGTKGARYPTINAVVRIADSLIHACLVHVTRFNVYYIHPMHLKNL